MAKSRRSKEQRQRRRSRVTTGEISHKFSESSEMRFDTGQRRSSSDRTGSVDPGNGGRWREHATWKKAFDLLLTLVASEGHSISGNAPLKISNMVEHNVLWKHVKLSLDIVRQETELCFTKSVYEMDSTFLV